MWIVILIIVFIVLFALFSNNNTKKPPEDLYTKSLIHPVKVETSTVENTLFFEVTGVHISNRKNHLINNCSEYDQVELIPEPNNEYDSDAIKIKCNGKLIGYIKSDETELVHDILKLNYNAYISTLDYDGGYINVEITIDY